MSMTPSSQSQILDTFAKISSCKFLENPTPRTQIFDEIPVIDFTNPNAKDDIVKACKEFGFFKIINHEIPIESIKNLENEAFKFFNLPQQVKEKASHANPFGYGKNKIGSKGDIGWIEYLLFGINPQLSHHKHVSIPGTNSLHLRSSINEYVCGVRKMTDEVLKMMADGLKLEKRNVLSRLISDEESDTLFRLNHYPPCKEELSGRDLIGFGEHTDPQIISVITSNNAYGLQISLKDGTWVSVQPDDQHSIFILVGDSLQVMTNGRFKSVKHRAVTDGMESRLSMIFFAGPPMNQNIAPLPSLLMQEHEEEEEQSLYKQGFIWSEFKKYANNTRVSDNRLDIFLK